MNSKRPPLISYRHLSRRGPRQSSGRCWLKRPVTRVARLLIAGFAVIAAVPAQATSNVTGIWYNDTGKAAVQMYQCGPRLCGRIFWLRVPVNKAGRPLRDAYNPSPKRRSKPICGLQIIWGVQPQNDGTWDGGRIYDPKVGKSYNVAIEKLSAKQLRITGYLGTRLFGRSFIWRRAPADLAKCRTVKS